MYKITEKVALNPTVTKMVIEAPLIAKKAKPGQFIIVRPFEDSERIPLTVAGYDREKGTVDIIFQIVGGTTMELNSLNAGDCVHDFVGPLGRATETEGLKKVCVVGGGVGCAIALPIAKELHDQGCVVHSVVGFRNKDLLILEDEFNACSDELRIMTDDGSYGTKGVVTAALDELVAAGKSIRLAFFPQNESYSWPAWEILKKTVDASPQAITGEVKVTVAEEGPLRASVCVERTLGDSRFRQWITLREGAQADRIDLVNDIDWQSSDALLKAEFPLSVSNPEAVYDLGVGSVARGNNTATAYEVYAQQWADLTDADGSYGVSVLNDSKYGWDKPADNTLRLTLLHTPATKGGYAYQNKQDFGHHTFTYSIVGHAGDSRGGGAVRKAEVLNQPLRAFVAPRHGGVLGRSFSLVASQNPNVALRALKQAEDSDEYVVRFYETSGLGSQQAVASFAAQIVDARELNGVEDVVGDAEFSGRELRFEVGPFGMKTFRVKLARPVRALTPAAEAAVELPYNVKTASYNPFRSDSNFDGKGNSYAAELMPSRIVYGGVGFEIGDPAAQNGVKCRRDTIDLPRGRYGKLYLLAASTMYDTQAVFTVDGKEHTALVPYYGGFIGQWGHTGHTEPYLKDAQVAFVGTHKHDMIRNEDRPYEFTYMFRIGLDIPEGARQLVLPDDPRIVVFAATVAEDPAGGIGAACDLLRVQLPVKGADASQAGRRNLLYGKPVVERSGEVNASERAEYATDEDVSTKWCDYSDAKPKLLGVDLGRETTIRGWYVMHAALESLDYITKEYSLQVRQSPGEEWKTVDTVYDNTAFETDRILPEPIIARYVRLVVSKPDQSEGNTARIYEFEVY